MNEIQAQREWAPRTNKPPAEIALGSIGSGTEASKNNIENLIQSINNWHDDLDATIKNLGARLGPCLTPDFLHPALDETKLARSVNSALADRLLGIQSRLIEATRQLQVLKDRIDL